MKGVSRLGRASTSQPEETYDVREASQYAKSLMPSLVGLGCSWRKRHLLRRVKTQVRNYGFVQDITELYRGATAFGACNASHKTDVIQLQNYLVPRCNEPVGGGNST